jgi:hypothetical protein
MLPVTTSLAPVTAVLDSKESGVTKVKHKWQTTQTGGYGKDPRKFQRDQLGFRKTLPHSYLGGAQETDIRRPPPIMASPCSSLASSLGAKQVSAVERPPDHVCQGPLIPLPAKCPWASHFPLLGLLLHMPRGKRLIFILPLAQAPLKAKGLA